MQFSTKVIAAIAVLASLGYVSAAPVTANFYLKTVVPNIDNYTDDAGQKFNNLFVAPYHIGT